METYLGFLEDLPIYRDTQPYQIIGFGEHDAKTNCSFQNVHIIAEDARPDREDFSIQDQGFQFFTHKSSIPLSSKHCEDGDTTPIMLDYLEETMNLAKELLKAEKAIGFDWRFRRNRPDSTLVVHDPRKARQHALPVAHNAHCDLSYVGGYDRLKLHLSTQELDEVNNQETRCMIVNVWRPLNVVENAPLLLADRRSVRKSDLLEVDRVMIDKVEKGFLLKHNACHKWHYLSSQTPDEITIFKGWGPQGDDESVDYPPHGACNTGLDISNPRESIEVRLIVFFPKVPQC